MGWWENQLLLYSNSGGITYPTYTGKYVSGFSSSNKIQAATGTYLNFVPGSTLWLLLYNTGTIPTTTEVVLSSSPTGVFTKGFWITKAGTGAVAGHLYFLNLTGSPQFPVIPAGYSLWCIRWRASDNNISYAINGSAYTSITTVTNSSQDSTCFLSIGNGFAFDYLTTMGICHIALWSREATTTECSTNTFTSGNRFMFPAAVTSDASNVFDWSPARDWNGSAATTTSLGSSPITMNVSGSPSYVSISETRVPITNNIAWNGNVDVPETGYTLRDAWQTYKVKSSDTLVGIEYFATNTNIGAQIGVWSNGINEAIQSAPNLSLPCLQDFALPAGSNKDVEIWEGTQLYSSPTLASFPPIGIFVNALRLPPNSTPVYKTPPQHRLVLLGDSIMTGYYPTTPATQAICPLLRIDYPTSGTGGVTMNAIASNELYFYASTPSQIATNAPIIASELDGTVSNALWIQLGTNDYTQSPFGAVINFQTGYGNLVDAIHALVPNAIIYCQSPIQRIAPASEAANGFGDTLGAYRTAISNVVSTRTSFCTYVNGAAAAIVSNSDMYTDGIHITTQGCADYKAFIKSTLNY